MLLWPILFTYNTFLFGYDKDQKLEKIMECPKGEQLDKLKVTVIPDLENHPYGRKLHSKHLALKSSIRHWISTHIWL